MPPKRPKKESNEVEIEQQINNIIHHESVTCARLLDLEVRMSRSRESQETHTQHLETLDLRTRILLLSYLLLTMYLMYPLMELLPVFYFSLLMTLYTLIVCTVLLPIVIRVIEHRK